MYKYLLITLVFLSSCVARYGIKQKRIHSPTPKHKYEYYKTN